MEQRLSNGKEKELFRELRRTGNPLIREKLILSNIELAKHIASEYNFVKLDEDAMQLVLEGLVEAVDEFDPDTKSAFSHYIYIKIISNIQKNYPELRTSFGGNQNPSWQTSFKICREIIEKEYGITINEDESLVEKVVDLMIEKGLISETFKEENIERIKLHFCNISLENNLDEVLSVEDDNFNIQLEKLIEDLDIKDNINSLLDNLSNREKKIIELRFGLNGNTPKTFKEIGKIYGVTGARIDLICRQTLIKIRQSSKIKKLDNYYQKDLDMSYFRNLVHHLEHSQGYIEQEYLKDYKKAKEIEFNKSFYNRTKNIRSGKPSLEVLKEYEYYCIHNNEIYNYFNDLCNSNDLESKQELEEIFNILTPKEKLVIAIKYNLDSNKEIEDLKKDIDFESFMKALASFTKKLSYYYQYNTKRKNITRAKK